MHAPAANDPALAALGALLERQRDALQGGRADDLPALGAQVQAQLQALRARTGDGRRAQGLPAGQLAGLAALAAQNQALLQRRLQQVAAALDHLGQGQAGYQDARSRSTYTARHAGAAALRPRTLGQA